MEIVKKNILSLTCAVVALLALIALFWPVSGMYGATQTDLDKGSKTYIDASTLRKATRSWPVIPDVTTGVKLPLPRFPNEQVIGTGKKITIRVHEQTAEIRDITAKNNVHQLLVRNILPVPKDNQFQFANEYVNMVKVVFPQILGAAVPPTAEKIDQAGTALWNKEYAGKIVIVDGKPINQDNIVTDWMKETSTLQTRLYQKTAVSCKVYIDTDPNNPEPWISIHHDFDTYTQQTADQKPPTVEAIWFAQNMIWVMGDVVDAIAAINANYKNVTEAPIKQIIKLEMADDLSQYQLSTDASAASTAPGKAYALAPTGRISNPLYDVALFTLTLNVEAKKIPTILNELERGRLITIRQCEVSAADAQAAADNGFLYGPVPVAKLTIHGEELLLREWTVPLMPDSIKNQLQITVTPPTPPRSPG